MSKSNVALVSWFISIAPKEEILAWGKERDLKSLDISAELMLQACGIRSQADLAAFALNLAPSISDEALTEGLVLMFPNAKIGKRHAPYYKSKARTGKLKGCQVQPPSRRVAKQPKTIQVEDLTVDQLTNALKWKKAEAKQAASAK